MKPSAIRIERMLEKIEAALVPPPRPCLSIITREGDDQAAAMERAPAEHVACHPEDAGRTVKDFRWIIQEIVQRPRPNPMSADEISAAEISAAAARDEITKGEIEDEPLNGCKGTGGPSETPEPIDLPPRDPGCLGSLEAMAARASTSCSGSAPTDVEEMGTMTQLQKPLNGCKGTGGPSE